MLVARYREMRAGRPLAGLRASAAAVRPLPSPHHSWALPDTPPSHPSQLHPHPLRLPASGAPAVSRQLPFQLVRQPSLGTCALGCHQVPFHRPVHRHRCHRLQAMLMVHGQCYMQLCSPITRKSCCWKPRPLKRKPRLLWHRVPSGKLARRQLAKPQRFSRKISCSLPVLSGPGNS